MKTKVQPLNYFNQSAPKMDSKITLQSKHKKPTPENTIRETNDTNKTTELKQKTLTELKEEKMIISSVKSQQHQPWENTEKVLDYYTRENKKYLTEINQKFQDDYEEEFKNFLFEYEKPVEMSDDIQDEYQNENMNRLVRSNYENLFQGRGVDLVPKGSYADTERNNNNILQFMSRSEVRFNEFQKQADRDEGFSGLGINFLGEFAEDSEDKMKWVKQEPEKPKESEEPDYLESEVLTAQRTSSLNIDQASLPPSEDPPSNKFIRNFDSFKNSASPKNEYMLSSPIDSKFEEFQSDYKEDKVSLASITYSIGQSPSELSQRKSGSIQEEEEEQQSSKSSRRSSVMRRPKKDKNPKMEFTLGKEKRSKENIDDKILDEAKERQEKGEVEKKRSKAEGEINDVISLETEKDNEPNEIEYGNEIFSTKEMNQKLLEYELEMNQLALQISRGGSSFEEEIEYDEKKNKNIFFQGISKIFFN